MKDVTAALWGFGGLLVGAWAGSRFGEPHGRYGRGGDYGYGYAPGYGGYCNPGYSGYPDRPKHEDKQDEKIAFLMAESAANKVAIKKDEIISCLKDDIVRGDIFKATCLKPDGHVELRMSQIGSPYRDEPRYIDTHAHHDQRRFSNHGCGNDDCGNWY